MLTFIPTGSKILLRMLDTDSESDGGIVIPDSAKTHATATVVAVGPGIRNSDGVWSAPTVEKGDTVLLHPSAGPQIRLRDMSFTLVDSEDILYGVVRDDDEQETGDSDAG